MASWLSTRSTFTLDILLAAFHLSSLALVSPASPGLSDFLLRFSGSKSLIFLEPSHRFLSCPGKMVWGQKGQMLVVRGPWGEVRVRARLGLTRGSLPHR